MTTDIPGNSPGNHQQPVPQRVLVTGADGFIGAEVMASLRRMEPSVMATALDPGCDIRDAEAVASAVAGLHPDVVVHLAAVSGAMLFADHPDVVVATNAVGTVNVLQSALRAGVGRVLSASSVATFETPPASGRAPRSLYGATKIFGETLAQLYRARGLSTCCLRIGAVYGGRRRTADTLSDMVDQGLRTGSICYDARGLEPLIDVRDVGSLVAAAAILPEPRESYDVVGYVVPHRRLAEELAARLGCATTRKPEHSASGWVRPFDTWSLLEDTGRHLEVGLDQGLDQYLEYIVTCDG